MGLVRYSHLSEVIFAVVWADAVPAKNAGIKKTADENLRKILWRFVRIIDR
jgi:hypothetical protein